MLLSDIKYQPIRPRAKKSGDTTYIWDDVRKCYLVLTPEEWVRQHIIAHLRSECGFEAQTIVEEYPVSLNGTAQRADIVVLDNLAQPYLLVECKAMEVAIDEAVFAQAVRYNSVVKARFIVLTNGIKTAIFEVCEGEYRAIDHYPLAKDLTQNLEEAE
ncbi:MAG: type I restriction enzyme HsdR N-terminal domain-containing protein [Alistipes sp.]|nr:type I restriction enzyme HsdR N-terminal domain-containing protein [Alistipes sp.]